MRKFGFYWIRVNDADGILHTIAKYRPAYSFDEDKRNCWDIPGTKFPLYDTTNPNASNAVKVGKYLGEKDESGTSPENGGNAI